MSRFHPIRALLAGLCLAAAGCISVPDEVERDFEPPDGKRPNNFGKKVETKKGKWVVRPEVPTIPAAVHKPKGS